jgi:pilus assembly protein CpaF
MRLSERYSRLRDTGGTAVAEREPIVPDQHTVDTPVAPSRPAPLPELATSRALGPELLAVKAKVHARMVERHADRIDPSNRGQVKDLVARLMDEQLATLAIGIVTPQDRDRLIDQVVDEAVGLGVLEGLLRDPEVTEIMVNRRDQIFVERRGELEQTSLAFSSEADLRTVIDRIVSSIGRRVDESSPAVDARLKDGSRVNVVIPPVAFAGACMTIRKFSHDSLGPEDLTRRGSATQAMLDYMETAVRSRLNVIVSGGTGSGKTTLLNLLSSFIPPKERIITCEDAAELKLRQVHVISMETKPPNVEGKGAFTIRDLVRNCLRMRPDRIVVGECRGAEALDMLQAMNTGHDGSMSTIHANSPRDAINRLETLVLIGGSELPLAAIRTQIASAVNVIVQTARLRGGPRKVTSIAEVMGLENGEVKLQEVFLFKQMGVTEEGRARGYHTATGVNSFYAEHFEASGEEIDRSIFEPTAAPPTERLY